MLKMQIEMFRLMPHRRQPYRIFAFGAGRSLRLDLGVPQEVPDELGYKILSENSTYIRKVEAPKKAKKPKAPKVKAKQVTDEQITTS
jgi:hypothetical protein